jgi:hypothetical protein
MRKFRVPHTAVGCGSIQKRKPRNPHTQSMQRPFGRNQCCSNASARAAQMRPVSPANVRSAARRRWWDCKRSFGSTSPRSQGYAFRRRAAISGTFVLHQKSRYSINSSAVTGSLSGTVSPSSFTVLSLIASSNVVGCGAGSCDGLAPPLRVRPA